MNEIGVPDCLSATSNSENHSVAYLRNRNNSHAAERNSWSVSNTGGRSKNTATAWELRDRLGTLHNTLTTYYCSSPSSSHDRQGMQKIRGILISSEIKTVIDPYPILYYDRCLFW